jgi:exosortase C (VPDSG-CTERM-specific)
MGPPDRFRLFDARPRRMRRSDESKTKVLYIMNAEIHGALGANPLAVRRQLLRLGGATGLLAVCFGWPLRTLFSFAWHSELFSYILLIPFISGYLIWTMRKSLNFEAVRPCWPGAALGLAAGGAIIAGYWIGRLAGWKPETQDYLTVMMLALLCCFWGVCLAVMGSKLLGQILFPIAFLAFLVPMPTSWLAGVDTFFQYTSAAAAEAMLRLIREPVVRDGLTLQLTNFGLRVAPECSGIHSTIVLIMTSFLAGYLFLRRFWTRSVLVLAMIPLAILRNGFRVAVIGWLCVHISPDMINSPIHHRGGPIFFALSLIPFFLLLFFLRKRDSTASAVPETQTKN